MPNFDSENSLETIIINIISTVISSLTFKRASSSAKERGEESSFRGNLEDSNKQANTSKQGKLDKLLTRELCVCDFALKRWKIYPKKS